MFYFMITNRRLSVIIHEGTPVRFILDRNSGYQVTTIDFNTFTHSTVPLTRLVLVFKSPLFVDTVPSPFDFS